MSSSQRNKGYLALAATSILWGTTWVASKSALKKVPGLEIAAIRQFLAGSIFLVYFLFFKKMALPNFKQFGYLVMMAVLLFVIANGMSTWGLHYIPTGLASLIGAMYPMCVVLIETHLLKKKNTTRLTWLGMLIGFTGVLFLIGQFGMKDSFGMKAIWGLLASLIAMLSWSVGSILLARKDTGLNPYFSMGWQMILGCLFTTFIVMVTGDHIPLASIETHSWLMICYLVIVGSVLAFIAFLYSLKTLPAALSSLYAYINPIVASITASFTLNETLTPSILFGTIFTLAGVFIVNKSVKRKDAEIEAEI